MDIFISMEVKNGICQWIFSRIEANKVVEISQIELDVEAFLRLTHLVLLGLFSTHPKNQLFFAYLSSKIENR